MSSDPGLMVRGGVGVGGEATYSRAVVDHACGLVPGVSPQVLAAQVERRGALHVQTATQATVGKHGVADTCAERREREVKVSRFQSRMDNLISDTPAASTRELKHNFSFRPDLRMHLSGPASSSGFLSLKLN